MLRALFQSFRSQTSQKAAFDQHASKRIDASQLKLVAGGLPRGGWLESQSTATTQLPRGGWC